MFKHQKTISCRAMAYNKGQTEVIEPQEVMVVVVTNYQRATQVETVQSEVSINGKVEDEETRHRSVRRQSQQDEGDYQNTFGEAEGRGCVSRCLIVTRSDDEKCALNVVSTFHN